MKQLVFIENGRPVTDSLTVAEVFNKRHADVLRDIEVQLEKLHEAGEGEWGLSNFAQTQYQHPQNKQWYPKYNLTEDAFTIVAMSYVTPEAMKMKVKFIKEFKRMREQLIKLSTPSYMIEDPIKRAEKWIEEQREKQALEAKIEQDKPKVIFAEALEVSDTSILVGELAKLLRQNGIQIGQNRLFHWLRSNGYLGNKGEYYNMPTQKAMEMELFEIKTRTINNPDGSVRTTRTPKVTVKGQIYFINKFKANQQKSVS